MDVWGFLTLIALGAAVVVAVLSRTIATIVAGTTAVAAVVVGALLTGGGPASAPWTLAALVSTGIGVLVAELTGKRPIRP